MLEKPKLAYHVYSNGMSKLILSFKDPSNQFHREHKPSLFDLTLGLAWWYFRGIHPDYMEELESKSDEFKISFMEWKHKNNL